MALKEEFVRSGNWLFKWRSYLPLLLILIVLLGMRNSDYRGPGQLWGLFCLCVSFLGLGIRIVTISFTPKGTSGRNTKSQVADTLNTTGIYSIVRNPLYLGNFVIWFGISLYVQLWYVSLIFILAFWLYYERIIFAEEEYLRNKFGDGYLEWAERTPAFFPKFKNWQAPDLNFSLRNVLKREYIGFFVIVLTFVFLEIMNGLFVKGSFELNLLWRTILIAGIVIFLILRILAKKTKILDVEGR